MLRDLANRNVLSEEVVGAVEDLVAFGNQAGHGVVVSESAGDLLREKGPSVLAALDALLQQGLGTASVGDLGTFEVVELGLLDYVMGQDAQGRAVTDDDIVRLVGASDAAVELTESTLRSDIITREDGALVATARGRAVMEAIEEIPSIRGLIAAARSRWQAE